MARPQIQIDKEQFEKLCGLQCPLDEIADWFTCSPDTIERWCKRTYNKRFADVFSEKRGRGKIALRRAQFELAKHNASMAIFLGKNYLGQGDNGAYMSTGADLPDDPLTASLREEAERMNDVE